MTNSAVSDAIHQWKVFILRDILDERGFELFDG